MKLGFNKLTDYTVRFDVLKRSDDDLEYGAHIDTGKSEHGGIGRSPAEALFHAASHWLSYTNLPRDWQNPVWTDEADSWHRYVAGVIRSGWSMLTDEQKRTLATACAENANRSKRT